MKPYPRAILWVFALASVGLQAAALWLLREASVPILSAGIPATLALCGVDRWSSAWTATKGKTDG